MTRTKAITEWTSDKYSCKIIIEADVDMKLDDIQEQCKATLRGLGYFVEDKE